jgi:hypothetical protein
MATRNTVSHEFRILNVFKNEFLPAIRCRGLGQEDVKCPTFSKSLPRAFFPFCVFILVYVVLLRSPNVTQNSINNCANIRDLKCSFKLNKSI